MTDLGIAYCMLNVDFKLTPVTGSWSDHHLLNGTMVMTMVDHGQMVMVIDSQTLHIDHG